MTEFEKVEGAVRPSKMSEGEWKIFVEISRVLTDIEEYVLDSELTAITGVS